MPKALIKIMQFFIGMSGDRLEQQEQNMMMDKLPDNNMCTDSFVLFIPDTFPIGLRQPASCFLRDF